MQVYENQEFKESDWSKAQFSDCASAISAFWDRHFGQ